MDAQTLTAIGKIGGAAALGLAATGSALGAGEAAISGVGAWKKCYAQNRLAPFLLVAFIGAPLSQTIYGLILMLQINARAEAVALAAPALLALGVGAGLAMGVSAWMQGRAAAGCCDSFAETNKGFANNLLALGVVETVALFAMVFGLIFVGSVK
ncbi:MAG: V-type ATP synthase subunit K [Lentisphaeria bacterium]|jgi:V/A-type H+-transporting ATPase subunit K